MARSIEAKSTLTNGGKNLYVRGYIGVSMPGLFADSGAPRIKNIRRIDVLERQSEKFVLASKFTKAAVPNADLLVTGNGRKVASVEASLKRLKTDWIDIYCDDGNLTAWRRSKWLKGVVLVKMAA
jgi:hypothetical protein